MLQAYLFVMGMVVGSFLNVVIDRLSQNQTLLGRSHCDHCKTTLQPIDLVPVLSFIALRGRCRTCKHGLSVQYPIVELLTGAIFLSSWVYSESLGIVGQLGVAVIFSSLLAMFVSDIKYRILLDELQVTLLVGITIIHLAAGKGLIEIVQQALFGFVVLTPLLIIFIGSRGKGMGFGDVKLAFNIGYLFGVVGGFIALYLSFVSGGLIGICLILSRKAKLKQAIAFGPFLIVSMAVYFIFKEQLVSYVNTIFGLQ